MLDILSVLSEDIIKLLAAVVIGSLIGAEREYHDKAAGLRTLILICVGSTLFTLFSVDIARNMDPGRVAAQIVTGIGFLGTGVILHERGRVRGLTTASTIWFTAALGIGIGIGQGIFAFIATVLALFVLRVLPAIEKRMEQTSVFRDYQITTDLNPEKPKELDRLFSEAGLSVKHGRTSKRKGQLVTEWIVAGKADAHERAIAKLIRDPAVKGLEY
jgi:putative Mg2+ transporter-C (MgtC) family protein